MGAGLTSPFTEEETEVRGEKCRDSHRVTQAEAELGLFLSSHMPGYFSLQKAEAAGMTEAWAQPFSSQADPSAVAASHWLPEHRHEEEPPSDPHHGDAGCDSQGRLILASWSGFGFIKAKIPMIELQLRLISLERSPMRRSFMQQWH